MDTDDNRSNSLTNGYMGGHMGKKEILSSQEDMSDFIKLALGLGFSSKELSGLRKIYSDNNGKAIK